MTWTIYVGSDLILSTHVEEDGERKMWEQFHIVATDGNKTYVRRLTNDDDEELAEQLADVFQEQAASGTFDVADGWEVVPGYERAACVSIDGLIPDWN